SVIDMRHGLVPYRDVFSSQGPLHLPLLFVGDLIGLRTIDAPRTASLLAGVVVVLAGYACARRLGGNGTFTASLLATSGTMIWTTGQITGDGPAAALSAVAILCALRYRDASALRRAVLCGLFLGAALATKPLVVPIVIPIAWWLRRSRGLAF